MYNLENTHIASNVSFTSKLQELRAQLRTLFDKSNTDKSTDSTSKQSSLMQNIKNVTGSAYDTTQVINLIEQFFSLNLLPENRDSKMIIEQYASVFPFLNNYKFKNELFMHVFDISLTLGLNYEQSLTLLKCACRHAHEFENNSDYLIFFENIQKAHQDINSLYNQSVSVPNILLEYKYPLSSKQLVKKFTFLKNIEEHITKMNDTKNQNDLECFLKIIKNFNDYFKSLEITVSVNYLQRVQTYMALFSKIFDITRKVTKPKKYFNILKMKRSQIVDKIVFGSNINPVELEDIFIETNLNLVYHLMINCSPKIDIKQYQIDEDNLEIDYSGIKKIIELLTEKVENEDEKLKVHTPNDKMLAYINKYNSILAYLLVLMYPECNEQKIVDLDTKKYFCLDNLVCLNRTNNLKDLYENAVVASLQNFINKNTLYRFIINQNTADHIDLTKILKIISNLPERQLKKDTDIQNLKDALLNVLIEQLKTADNFKYVEIIENASLRTKCILNNLHLWSGDVCIRILKETLSNFNDHIDEETKIIVADWLNKITMYEDICFNTEFKSWYEVYLKSNKNVGEKNNLYDPANVLEALIANKKIQSSINWLQYHKIDKNLYQLIDAEYIKDIFATNSSTKIIESIFNQIPVEKVETISSIVFKSLRNLKQLEFLIDYILKCDKINSETFHNIYIGIKLLLYINPSEYEENLWLLIDQPLLILEQYIMNARFEKLNQLFKAIDNLLPNTAQEPLISITKIDNLLRYYAERALEFRIQSSATSNSIVSTESSGVSRSDCRLLQSIDSINSTTLSENISFVMPEQPPIKSEWMRDYETNICLCCNETEFSMFNRRHHCRRCGRVVCGLCSTKRMKISIYGDVFVRVCNQCYNLTTQLEECNEYNDATALSMGDRPDNEAFVDFWQLTDDLMHNNTIREEFSFEYAPSVSLCLSILKFHSQCENYPKFLLSQCNAILRLIVPSKMKLLHHEIDYNMVIQMLRSLLLAAKVSCDRNSYDSMLVHCDQLLGQIDILKMLASNDCLELLPDSTTYATDYKSVIKPLSELDLRKLRDNLMENEKWNLALEVTTKGGLDTTGIFAAWGKACLKAGCFQQAREKFQYCLDKIKEENLESVQSVDSETSKKPILNRLRHSESRLSNITITGSTVRPNKNPGLISEIIEILESFSCYIDQTVLKNADLARNNTPVIKFGQNATPVSIGLNDPALHILNKLANLKNLSNGHFNALYPDGQTCNSNLTKSVKRKNSKQQQLNFKSDYRNEVHMEPCIYTECLYYLQSYGSHFGLIEFYLRHNRMKEAILYIMENKLDNEYYVDLYVYCLKNGCIGQLQYILIDIDSTLEVWKDGLKCVCRYLEQNGFLHILYQMQEWLGDHVRAAMTCIKFFQVNAYNYTDLLGNLEYLHNAQSHLKTELESDDQWVQVEPVKKGNYSEKSLVLKMDSRDIDKHINTIWRQVEVTKFLASNEKLGRKTIDLLPEMFQFTNDSNFTKNTTVPTLFSSKMEKIQLAVLTIISGENVAEGFGIAFRIIQDFQLNSSKIYCIVAKQLATNGNYAEIQSLVESITTSGMPEDTSTMICDEVLAVAVRTLAEIPSYPIVQIESLIKLIHDVNIKITAYIESKQLKSAYLLAIRHDRTRDVRRILREAERLNQPHIRSICAKRLAQVKDSNK